ncbi:MAG: hypothetical protein ERJ67_10150 [Aphanocapsa feldmannii 277cV]|uniref:Uncharacterized protein n=1 Tax=Aphanocapsa feldmannii 277cV TaxID=2507553 RepID=A0A524RL62_9CHRO|nr:MAG: hypothetical protein ERJ67_10150 [Aphanocapsa feldmannii 277cV]
MVVSLSRAYGTPEQDPFVVLDPACMRWSASCRVIPSSRCVAAGSITHPYGEEEVAHLEEEVLPAITACLKRIDEIDARLQVRGAARRAALPPSWPVDHPPATAWGSVGPGGDAPWPLMVGTSGELLDQLQRLHALAHNRIPQPGDPAELAADD